MVPGTIPVKAPAGTGYTAEVTFSAPVESVFTAVATVEGLRGWRTPDASGSAGPGGGLRSAFASHGAAVMRVEDLAAPALVRCPAGGTTTWPAWPPTSRPAPGSLPDPRLPHGPDQAATPKPAAPAGG